MTTPGGNAPDGAWVLGSGFGQDVTEQSFNALMRGQGTQRGYETAHHSLMAQLGQLLLDVAAGLVQGAIDLGGTVVGVVTDIVDGIVNLVRNLAGAILGGGSRAAAAGLPDSFEPGELADIADGQRELLDRFDLLEENAGHAQATMSKHLQVPANRFRAAPFDTLYAPPKNIILSNKNLWSHGSLSDQTLPWLWGFVPQAPGVWSFDTRLTIDPQSNSVLPFYVETMVWRAIEVDDNPNMPGTPGPWWELQDFDPTFNDALSVSRSETHTNANRYDTVSLKKPMVCDVFRDEQGRLHTYFVATMVRQPGSNAHRLIGGARFSTFSADRLSTDATDYGAPEEATGTETA